MSYTKIWIHAVWGTKWREPLLTGRIRGLLFRHIKENAKSKGIDIRCINGVADHVHCLFQLRGDQNVCFVMQMIKGESAHWMNTQRITRKHFEWANEYFAGSISASAVKTVKKYIRNQEEHHGVKPFDREFADFLKCYGVATKPQSEDLSRNPKYSVTG